jgi:organic hydroperoxide reductase OsmC/OhrA
MRENHDDLDPFEQEAMRPLPHRYCVRLTGGASGAVQLSAAGLPDLRSAPPAEYDGPGDAWSPEHLLLAAVQACFLFTLRAIAGLSKLECTAIDVEAIGTVDRQDGVTRFTEIVLRSRLTVPPGTDRNRAEQVLEKSKKACLVTASLSTPVRLESELTEE